MTDDEQKSIISQNLKHYIERSGKEQKQIAIDLDIQLSTFNSYVTGRALPSVSQLKRIAAYFKVNLLNIVNRNYAAAKEELLVNLYNALNEAGKDELIKYANLLLKSGDFDSIEWRVSDED